MHCLTFLQISLLSSLIEDNWIHIIAPEFKLLQYVVLVEVYQESSASHSYIAGTGKNIFWLAFYDRGPLGHYIKTTRSSFLRASCTVEPETISMNFSSFFYRGQAHATHYMACQKVERQGIGARKVTLFGNPADQEDGGLMS